MSIKNTWYLPDSIGFVKWLSAFGDNNSIVRNAAHKGGEVSINFKMPVNIAYLWFNFIQAANFTDFSRSTIMHTADFWIPNINNRGAYIKSINNSIDIYNSLLKVEEDAQGIHGIVPQGIYIEFTETGYLDDYIKLCEQCKGTSTLANGIYMYADLITKLIDGVRDVSEKVNVPNRMSDNPAEYQWGC